MAYAYFHSYDDAATFAELTSGFLVEVVGTTIPSHVITHAVEMMEAPASYFVEYQEEEEEVDWRLEEALSLEFPSPESLESPFSEFSSDDFDDILF